jgi:hypothetical protein
VNLKIFYIHHNQLETIDSSTFDQMKGLMLVDLRENVCIDDAFNNSETFGEMKHQISKNCSRRKAFDADVTTPDGMFMLWFPYFYSILLLLVVTAE